MEKRRGAICRIYECGGDIGFRDGRALGRHIPVSVSLSDLDPSWKAETVGFGTADRPGCDADLISLLDLSEVQCVNLFGEGFTDACLEHLAQLPHLDLLDLNETSITIYGLSRFSRFRELHCLTLRGIRDSELDSIDRLTGLEHLQIISSPEFTDAGLAHLKSMSSIHALDVYRTPITGEGFRYLVALANLRALRLDDTQVNNDAIGYLTEMSNLRSLDIDESLIDEAGLKRLREGLPDCEITLRRPMRGTDSSEARPARGPVAPLSQRNLHAPPKLFSGLILGCCPNSHTGYREVAGISPGRADHLARRR